jgi:hypothetical protein
MSEGFYGDKSDGNVTINAGTTTLAASMQYDVLTIASGATLDVDGWILSCHRLILTDNTSIVGEKGATGTTSAKSTGNVRPGTGGSAGGTGAGTAGSSTSTIRSGGNSGAGGAGSGGAGGAAATGVHTVGTSGPPAVSEDWMIFTGSVGLVTTVAGTTTMPYGGGGGGGGGGDGGAGGNGGQGGRIVRIRAKLIT